VGTPLTGVGIAVPGRGSRAVGALLALAAAAGLICGCPPWALHGRAASVSQRCRWSNPCRRPTTVAGATAGECVRPHRGRLDEPEWAHDLYRIYVPNSLSNTVTEINPHAYQVIRTFKVAGQPNHTTHPGVARCCG